MAKQFDDGGWRDWVLNSMLPTMEATSTAGTAGFTPATAADFGPVTFHGNRTPDVLAALLDGLPQVRAMAVHQRALDLHAQLETHEALQELRLEVTGLKNRLADLKRPLSEGGSPVPATAWQLADAQRKLERAEKELARRVELKETRTVRWTAAAQFDQAVSDWGLRGIPGDCVVETIANQPVSELLKKGETKSDGVMRYRHRIRECDADAHRVNSAQWPISVIEADAKELIERRADEAAPLLESAIEHGQPISFAKMQLSGLTHNSQPGAVTFIEVEDAVGLICWLFRKELLTEISAGFREIGDHKNALDQRQREEMFATISADRLAAERAECALIWPLKRRAKLLISDPTRRRWLRLAWRFEPCRAQPRHQRHRSMVTTSSAEGSDDTGRAAGGLAACFHTGMRSVKQSARATYRTAAGLLWVSMVRRLRARLLLAHGLLARPAVMPGGLVNTIAAT